MKKNISPIKVLLLSAILLLQSFTNADSQSKVFADGEQLNYVVYYGFIRLGEVRMNVEGRKTEGDKIIYSVRSTMKSYDGIPFVSLNSMFESEIVFDGKEAYSRRFKATEHKDDGVFTVEYNFNYDSSLTYIKKTTNGNIDRDDKVSFNRNIKFQDGLSLFYSARINSFKPENYLIPVFMNESETSVSYYFSSTPDKIEIKLFDDDLSSVRCTGTANFTGVFGLTGEFAGWFSNDEERIPLRSQMNVIIGNVTLELDSYKRTGWKHE